MPKIMLRPFDQSRLNNLINQFEASHPQTHKLSKIMRTWKPNGYVTSKEKNLLVDWCRESEDTRSSARAIAREISELVFGKVLDEYD